MFSKIRARISFIRFHLVHTRSRAYIERWQARRLARMIAHVQRNVPMYKRLYARIDPSIMKRNSLDILPLLPVVAKRDFRAVSVEEYTDNSALADGSWIMTSGTSGEPFTVLARKDLSLPYYADSLVYRAFVSRKPWLYLDKPRIVRIMTKSPRQKNRLFLKITDFRKDPAAIVARIRQFKPQIIESFASILYDIARQVELEDIPLTVPYIISGGERMTDGLRTYLEKTLGCEVYNRLGMEEFSVVAMECARHDGLHTSSESLIVEVVDEHGQPVPDGTEGRIVITDLYNTTMPYLRYDSGDHGKLTWARCGCGNTSPRLWLEGRYSAWLSFGGRRINHLEYDLALDSFMNVIIQYQVVKKSETEAVVVVIPGIGFSDIWKEQIRQSVSDLVGEHVQVRIECVKEIPRAPRGKSQIVADHSS